MSLEHLITKTRGRFPCYKQYAVEIFSLAKGGSDRKYYRVTMSEEYSLILVKCDPQKPENARFVAIATFLEEAGINAPFIYYHDPVEGLIWMQDLGSTDLWHYRHHPWPVRKGLYENVLDQVATLHAVDLCATEGLGLMSGFDEGLYRWEQHYGFENCFGRYFGLSAEEIRKVATAPALARLAAQLCRYPPQLIHRDLQSQNILIWEGASYLIDFQGMRAGLAAYDLASLLYDPYVTLTAQERAELLRYYYVRASVPAGLDEFTDLFRRCALQRLLQALGAYGTIGLLRGKPEFLRHIHPALRNLQEVASQIEGFTFLAEFTAQLLECLPPRPSPSPTPNLNPSKACEHTQRQTGSVAADRSDREHPAEHRRRPLPREEGSRRIPHDLRGHP
jgi:N-acetylmuramate 1-kinase